MSRYTRVIHSCISTETHYYPGGLPIANISSVAYAATTNPYQYQGDNAEQDDETGWNDFPLRTYDPQTLRWLQVDPYDQFASPYIAMGNNPIKNIDPSGGDILDFIGDNASEMDDDFFRNADGNTFWSSSTAECLDVDGVAYQNIGATYTEQINGITYNWYGIGNIANFTMSGGESYVPLNNGIIRASTSQTIDWTSAWKENTNFFSKLAYNIADMFYITSQTFRMPVSDMTHLGGGLVTPKEAIGAFTSTTSSLLFGGVGAAGSTAEVGATDVAGEVPDYVYHYTNSSNIDKINKTGLRPSADGYVYATPEGKYTSDEAISSLKLNPEGGARDAVYKIDVNALKSDGILPVAGPRPVVGGTGTEILFGQSIPPNPNYITLIK